MKYKYTKEAVAEAVAASVTIAGALRYLGVKVNGGTHSIIVGRIREYGLDTSHFTGSASNRGPSHKGGPEKKSASLVLVKRVGGRQHVARLRRALSEIGRPIECVKCGIGSMWNGLPIQLEIDHLNGDNSDDRPENLQYICPNCHSQLPTSKGKRKVAYDVIREVYVTLGSPSKTAKKLGVSTTTVVAALNERENET